MTRTQELQRLYHHYKEVTGKTEVSMHDVAKFALRKGWPLPSPIDPIDRLAKDFSRAAREEIKHDQRTGRPYRVNHAVTTSRGSKQLTLWIEIDEAQRKPMLKSLIQRREQMVGDGLQLSFDMEHWNIIHPDQEPIALPLDLTDDVEWRKNAPRDDKQAS